MYPSCRFFEQRYIRDIKPCYKASHLCPHSTVRKMKLYLIESYFNINNVNLALLTTPYILSVVQNKPIMSNEVKCAWHTFGYNSKMLIMV